MTARTVNLTVIGDRGCSTTRTYLSYMRAAGLRPRRLWLVDFFPASPLVHWARRLLGSGTANFLQRREIAARLSPSAEFIELCNALQESATPQPVDLFGSFEPSAYADEVESFVAEDYSDGYLQRRMLRHADTAFLYTNGGRVPGSLLEQPGLSVFHVHPGVVPDVRGSDCLLWSYLVRGRLGASCFYMSAGIDEGDVIARREFDVPSLAPLRPFLTKAREELAYRALLFAVDPHFRAQIFVDVLQRAGLDDLRFLSSAPQPLSDRPAFLWMHPRLRLRTLREMTA